MSINCADAYRTLKLAQCPCVTSAPFAGEPRRTVVGVVIPKCSANPWKRIWENLIRWGDFITNKNRIGWCGQPSEGPRDQFGARMRGEYGDAI
jgi:hypothetical protein